MGKEKREKRLEKKEKLEKEERRLKEKKKEKSVKVEKCEKKERKEKKVKIEKKVKKSKDEKIKKGKKRSKPVDMCSEQSILSEHSEIKIDQTLVEPANEISEIVVATEENDNEELDNDFNSPQAIARRKAVKAAKKKDRVNYPKKIKSGLLYLLNWKNYPKNWKFNKNRQFWLIDHIYNLSEEHFKIAMQYFAAAIGSAKDQVIKDAREKETNDEHHERAIQVLKALV